MKVIIQCRGGVVNAVYSDNPDLEVELLDYDELDYGEMIELNETRKNITRLEKEIEGLEVVF